MDSTILLHKVADLGEGTEGSSPRNPLTATDWWKDRGSNSLIRLQLTYVWLVVWNIGLVWVNDG